MPAIVYGGYFKAQFARLVAQVKRFQVDVQAVNSVRTGGQAASLVDAFLPQRCAAANGPQAGFQGVNSTVVAGHHVDIKAVLAVHTASGWVEGAYFRFVVIAHADQHFQFAVIAGAIGGHSANRVAVVAHSIEVFECRGGHYFDRRIRLERARNLLNGEVAIDAAEAVIRVAGQVETNARLLGHAEEFQALNANVVVTGELKHKGAVFHHRR